MSRASNDSLHTSLEFREDHSFVGHAADFTNSIHSSRAFNSSLSSAGAVPVRLAVGFCRPAESWRKTASSSVLAEHLCGRLPRFVVGTRQDFAPIPTGKGAYGMEPTVECLRIELVVQVPRRHSNTDFSSIGPIKMSSETDPNSHSPAKDQFTSAAAEKMESARTVPPERSLWKGGYSPKAMYGTWVISALLTIVALVLAGLFVRGEGSTTIWTVIGACILVWWCIAIGMYLYRRLGMHYELTTQRFVHQSGILLRQTDRIEVIDIDDVGYTQGIVQRMLGVGKIRITGSDRTHPELILHGIDKVPEIASLIDDVRREERRRRSLHIESI